MRRYHLLQNNRQSGPYSIAELTAKAVNATDLVRIEGKSTSWKYLAEIEALPSVAAVEAPPAEESGVISETEAPTQIFVAFPSQLADVKSILKARQAWHREPAREKYAGFRKKRFVRPSKSFSKPHAALWLSFLFTGTVLSAVLLKNLAAVLDHSSMSQAAAVFPDSKQNESDVDGEYQNALTIELIPVDTATLMPAVKAPAKVNLMKLVGLEANDYQVGLLGGIKNLRLLVTNKSGFMLDKVKIQLHYLKQNGAVLRIENLVVNAVAPKSCKGLAVAAENKGVKIACHITGIQSKQESEQIANL